MKNINETLKTDNSKAISLGLVTLILVVLLHFLNLTAYIGLSFPVALFIGAYIGKSQGAIIYSVLVIIQMFIFPGALSESLIRLVVALLTYLIFLTRRVVRQKEWISVSVFSGIASYLSDAIGANIWAVSIGYSGISDSWRQANFIRAIIAVLVFAGLCQLWKNVFDKKKNS
jgi:Kef-type K+ transport system membrane component KefB